MVQVQEPRVSKSHVQAGYEFPSPLSTPAHYSGPFSRQLPHRRNPHYQKSSEPCTRAISRCCFICSCHNHGQKAPGSVRLRQGTCSMFHAWSSIYVSSHGDVVGAEVRVGERSLSRRKDGSLSTRTSECSALIHLEGLLKLAAAFPKPRPPEHLHD